ncbi:hypothetical protein LCGC14_0112770 [marine sediment metagenome]|uniref:Type IV leader peptidase family protein n=2 Tax=root TaxID=1 RepID=A0A7V1BEN2_9RHOB|nr:hypothetical protein [Sulfitobacter litoralis]HDZ51455.1 hypothetical protein [Sulfitobacter litoralis]
MSIVAAADLHDVLTAGIVLAAIRLIWVDYKRLEIELETLTLMAAIAVLQSALYVDVFETGIRLFAGAAFWGVLVFSSTRFAGLARFGAGDPPLIGVIAFLVAPYVLYWALIAAVMMLMTCAWYSIRRGKRLFKSMYPAAPPLLVSGMLVYLIAWA